ncbi:MAG TPA: glycosyltransferase [Candidatus Polarisedimenticolia bacterium]|jgi:cellulose synthase/poly-beta-1,6-N-acetylglucosamine synthase-like glycosyltransferase
MTWPAVALQVAYFTVLSLLAIYGLHRLSLVWIYLRRRGGEPSGRATGRGAANPWPPVTVQLPIYNEYYVVERLIEAACALRYPAGLIEIQLLDDSTDATSALAARLVASYRARGHDIHHIRRAGRDGYKAGALAGGLAASRGELIAIFDADFIPPVDFLETVVPRFAGPDADPRLGMAQARWGHTNRDDSLLTRAQALLLDGHFVVEHGARDAAGRFLNFNGTAGVFRRRCIEEAGGWQADTLTEDLDLSYRAQLAGWRFEYLPQVVVPAELPVELNALKSQQHRWAKGSIQTAMKLLRRLLTSPLPLAVRLEALAHLTNNAAYLLLAILAVLIVPALAARGEAARVLLPLDLVLFLVGTGSFALFCAVAQHRTRPDWPRALLGLPSLMAIGIGLSLNNGLAVIEALCGRRSEFHRTPKFGLEGGDGRRDGAPWRRLAYRGPRSALVLLEGAFALYFAGAVAYAAQQRWYAALPFLVLFAGGFLFVTGLSVTQEMSRLFKAPPARPEEAPAP